MDHLWIWLIYPLVNVYESLESLESYFKGPVCLDAPFGCQSWLGTCVKKYTQKPEEQLET